MATEGPLEIELAAVGVIVYTVDNDAIINTGNQWNVAAFYPLAMMSLVKDETQGSIQLAKLQAVILTLYALANMAAFSHLF